MLPNPLGPLSSSCLIAGVPASSFVDVHQETGRLLLRLRGGSALSFADWSGLCEELAARGLEWAAGSDEVPARITPLFLRRVIVGRMLHLADGGEPVRCQVGTNSPEAWAAMRAVAAFAAADTSFGVWLVHHHGDRP